MALALLMPPKGKAAADNQVTPEAQPQDDAQPSPTAPPHLTGAWDFSRLFTVAAEPEIVKEANESAEKVQHLAHNAWKMTVKAAKHKPGVQTSETQQAAQASATFKPKPMTYEEIRLWLQSFNAGPYALLKYEGDVPYKETRDYVPRVMKYYEQDLSSDYDDEINAAAAKYGLDPQMIKAIMKTESDFRNDCVSHAGARGLLQIMPVVWKDIKDKYELSWDYSTQVFEPQKNIEVGCAYLAWLRYDFLPRHFAAYEPHPAAPVVLVRDSDIGVPDRESPRLVAKSDTHTARPDAVAVASADVDVRQVVSDAEASAGNTKEKSSAKADTDKKEVASVSEKSASKKAAADDDDSEKKAARAASSDKSDGAKSSSNKQDSTAKEASSKEDAKSAGSSKTADAKGSSDKQAKQAEKKATCVEITDARQEKTGNGKVRVVTRGSGKAIAISVGKGGKVVTKEKSGSDDDVIRGKKETIAKATKATPREDRDTQGG
jgi:hypothetical protein